MMVRSPLAENRKWACMIVAVGTMGAVLFARAARPAVADEAAAPVYSAEDLGTYFHRWLLCGPLPLGQDLPPVDYKHGRQCTGFHQDLLASAGGAVNDSGSRIRENSGRTANGPNSHEFSYGQNSVGSSQKKPSRRCSAGGEGAADPRAGAEVSAAGKTHRWFLHEADTDLIPLDEIFTPNDFVVGYAFCKIRARRAGRVVLAVGSNDGVKIWLNGRHVHTYHPANGRWLQRDDDYVPVQLHEGLNRLLIKVDEGSGDFGFVARLLDYEKTVASIRGNLAHHTRLSVVPEADVAHVYFGQPYAVSLLNPAARVTVELVDQKGNRLAVRSARPGYQIDFPLADVAQGPLMFRAAFPVSDRETLRAECSHFHGKLPRHPNVKRIKNLAMVDDAGQPWLPIGMYGVPRSAYAKVKEAGVNFVMAGAADLDAAHQAGLKVAVGVHGSGAGWIDHIKQTVAAAGSHPAVLCWMMFDEPAYNRASLLQIHAAYQTLYQLDPIRPSYLVITTSSVYGTFGRCCDVLAIDTYPVSRGDYTAVPRSIERAYELSDGDQPVWHCGQLFAWPRDRPPTAAEHRYMTYSSLIAGAKAFLWYGYQHRNWTLPDDDPELWHAHVRLIAELTDLAPVIVSPGRGEPADLVDGGGMIRAVLKSAGERRFLLAANDSRSETVQCTFGLPPGVESEVTVYSENRTVTASGGRLQDTFRPLEVHVYRLNGYN